MKSASRMYLTKPLNNENKTAEELFAAANEQLHGEAKEWLMRTTENCTILSVFIATVSFAAIYTVPGGPDQNTGIPLLHSKPSLLVFTLADVISLVLALTSVGTFLSILTSSFPLEDFKIYLFKKLILGIICLVLSVSMMAVAFGAAIILMMSHNRENVFWSVIAFLPVPIFFLSYSPLRSAAMGPFREWFKIFIVYFLMGVVIVCILPLVLAGILSLFFDGIGWTVRKTCLFVIYKPLYWICWALVRILSLFFDGLCWTMRKACWICRISDTKSSQPTTAPPV